jgi:hypothetical protein
MRLLRRLSGAVALAVLGGTALAWAVILTMGALLGCAVTASRGATCSTGGAPAEGLFVGASIAAGWGWMVLLPIGLAAALLWLLLRVAAALRGRP